MFQFKDMSKRPPTQNLGEIELERKKPVNAFDQEVEKIVLMLGKRTEPTIPWVLEVELKRCTGETNRSGVSADEYEKVLSTIRKYPCWVETDTHTLVMSHGKNVRVTYDMKTKKCLGTTLKNRFENEL